MNLFINSPSYYTKEFGVIDEIYSMCQNISRNIDIRNYTNTIDSIGITPIIAPTTVIGENKIKEIKYVSLTYRMANISLMIDYPLFVENDLCGKKRLILENILESLQVVKRKLKNEFDYQRIEADIKQEA